MEPLTPSIGFLGVAIGCMAASALLMLSGRKTWANFVGPWAPSILILGTYNKIAKTFSPPWGRDSAFITAAMPRGGSRRTSARASCPRGP